MSNSWTFDSTHVSSDHNLGGVHFDRVVLEEWAKDGVPTDTLTIENVKLGQRKISVDAKGLTVTVTCHISDNVPDRVIRDRKIPGGAMIHRERTYGEKSNG